MRNHAGDETHRVPEFRPPLRPSIGQRATVRTPTPLHECDGLNDPLVRGHGVDPRDSTVSDRGYAIPTVKDDVLVGVPIEGRTGLRQREETVSHLDRKRPSGCGERERHVRPSGKVSIAIDLLSGKDK